MSQQALPAGLPWIHHAQSGCGKVGAHGKLAQVLGPHRTLRAVQSAKGSSPNFARAPTTDGSPLNLAIGAQLVGVPEHCKTICEPTYAALQHRHSAELRLSTGATQWNGDTSKMVVRKR